MGKRNISLITNVEIDTTASTATTITTATTPTTPTKRSRLSTLLTASASLLPSPLSEEDSVQSTHGLQILLVDDNQINLDILKRNLSILLTDRIERLEEARNGLEAIKLLNIYSFDLIFMDIDMPLLNGIDTTLQIRNNNTSNHANIPIIAITTNDSPKAKELYKSVGMNDCLSKPVNNQLLQQSLSKILSFISVAGGTPMTADAQTVSPAINAHASSLIRFPMTRSRLLTTTATTATTKKETAVSTISTTTNTHHATSSPVNTCLSSPPSTPTEKK